MNIFVRCLLTCFFGFSISQIVFAQDAQSVKAKSPVEMNMRARGAEDTV
jgi:hypothetical protein